MLKHYLKSPFLVFLLGLFVTSCGIIPPPYGYYERMGIEHPDKVAEKQNSNEKEEEVEMIEFEEETIAEEETSASSSAPKEKKTIKRKEDLLRENVLTYAEKYVGTKYRYGGEDPKGFDCSGFTYYVMKKFDISLDRTSRSQENDGKSIRLKEVKPGDLVFFRRSPIGSVFHVALVKSNDSKGLKVIHSTSRGVVVDNISESSYWKPKLSSARTVISE